MRRADSYVAGRELDREPLDAIVNFDLWVVLMLAEVSGEWMQARACTRLTVFCWRLRRAEGVVFVDACRHGCTSWARCGRL